MAQGFKVADAFISVHADDDTSTGRRKIERDTRSWAKTLGMNLGSLIGKGLVTGIVGALGALLRGTLMLGKLALVTAAIAAVASAIGALIGAIINLLPWIGELVSAAIAAAGALLLIPGAIATVIALVATLKIGLQGVSEALKAGLTGDVEKFNEALEKLAPNAQRFVRELVRLKPSWDRLRMPIQNALFSEMAELMRQLAVVYLPILEKGLTKVAGVLNTAFVGTMRMLTDPRAAGDIAAILDNAARAASSFVGALFPLLKILRDVAVVSSTVLADLSTGLVPIVREWADTIAQMREDGSLAQLILDGLAALKDFVGLAGDLIGILRGIFRAAGGSEGGGIFGFFERLNELVNSVSGQQALTELFTAFGDMAIALTPVLLVLVKAITPIAQGLAQIAVAFQPGLTALVEALGQALASLAPAIIALAPVFDALAMGMQPLADIISGLLIGFAPGFVMFLDSLRSVLEDLAPVAEPVGQALGLLAAVFGQLLAALAPVVAPLLGMLAQILIDILTPLIPLVEQYLPLLRDLWTEIFDNLSPILPALAQFVLLLIGEVLSRKDEILSLFFRWSAIMLKLSETFGVAFVQALEKIIPMLPGLIDSIIRFAEVVIPIIEAHLPAFIQGVLLLSEHGGGLQVIIYFIVGALTILSGILMIVDGAFRANIRMVSQFIEMLKDLKGAITGAVAGFASLLYNAGRNLIQGLINGVSSMIGTLKAKISSVATTVRNFFPFSPAKTGPLSGRGDLRYAGQNMVGGLVRGIQDQMTAAQQAANELAGIFRPGDPGLALAGGLAGVGFGAGGAAVLAPTINVGVQIGERPVRDMVSAEIQDNPKMVADAASEGNRVNAFIDPTHRRTGDS